MLTLDTEIIKNLERARLELYDDFTERTAADIANKCERGVLDKTYDDPFKRSDIFYTLINEHYTTNLREVGGYIVELFKAKGIGFRLFDITAVLHGYHRITLLWVVDRMEYGFDFIWKSDETNNTESFYRLGLINRCGDICKGDILELQQTIRYFCDNDELPDWFVSGLAHNT